ncbi:4-nitrophenylphosphatase [Lentibacillus sp. JNUCC-1]|uniref:TIGR01457 family HAD-type hydrolase n=1 Tax=Lentibacillus sp. JNUCC-1 TaxID=2654513 RepID=UPI0012E978C7|nr:TIGR01457 family HAD-type hydrolase [Lentibacillus sp. JNUCC-1]MUV39214.1 4-nitrophenylphosphatase [Lentibacillus sp. JNUCC-1]
MTSYSGYLIDLDGTMYNGTEPIDSAIQFVCRLKEQNKSYLFVTNNSSSTPEQVADKLQKMGVPAASEQIITSSLATATYIREQYGAARCYVIGEEGLKHALEETGHTIIDDDSQVDVVIVGIDRSVTYEKYAKACLHVRAGAAFISTNGDIAIPTERGMLPGNGALTSVIEVSTKEKPVFIGKPETTIMNTALKRMDLSKAATVMIGDNYDTDIMAGVNAGMDTLMVLTGVTTTSQLSEIKHKPTHVVNDLSEWLI